MTRRSIIGGLMGLLASAVGAQVCNQKQPQSQGCKEMREYERELHAMPKWYISISGYTEKVEYAPGQFAWVSYGRDRLEALGNANITVFTEKEWKELEQTGRTQLKP